jgi:transcriptional regulator with XRE-family HTH domain
VTRTGAARAGAGAAGAPAVIRTHPWQGQAGWLLRAHRLGHADPEMRRLAGFARAYRADARFARGVSPSSLSRWENGLVPVTAASVRRYEDVLGLAPYRLLLPIQTIARYEGGPAAAAFLHESGDGPLAVSPRRVDPLLDRVLDGGVVTGGDWDLLTRWAVRGGVHLSPGRVREAVVRRLLEETLVSGGSSWMRRFEALSRLMADPRWGPETIAACAAVAEQSEHAGLIEAVCALDGSPHPDAGRAVLRQLTDPTTVDSMYGALLACARKTRKHHFDAGQTRRLVDVVEGVLADGSAAAHSLSVVGAAAVLLHRLPLPAGHTARLTAAAAGHHPAVGAIVAHGSLTDPLTAAITVSRVVARIGGDAAQEPSPGQLSSVVDDVLHHPVADIRLYAAMLLHASPYGPRLAAALAAELRRPATVRAEAAAVPVLDALRVLGGPGQRGAVADLTLVRGLPHGVDLAAVHALGHLGGRSPESYWRAVFSRHTRAAADASEQQRILKRLVYGFAMAGELDLLGRLVEEQAQAAAAQPLSGWWSGLSQHVRESARR